MKGLFAAASVVALVAGAPAWAQTAPNRQVLSSQDQRFIRQAGAGNLAEARLGQLAMHKAATPAIKEFGRWMRTDHGFANLRLTAVIREIGITNFHPTLTPQDRELQQRLEGVSGEQFDRQYIQAMVRDHRMTIPKFRQEARDGYNPLLKTYARNLLPVLDQHLAEAEQLAGTGGVAMGTAARPAARSGSSINRYNR